MTTTEVAKRYFEALSAHDLDAVIDCWEEGGVDRLVGQQELVAPHGTRAYFKELFEAFPNFRFEVADMTTYRNRDQARESMRKVAALEPSVAWAGHADPVTGDVRRELDAAASRT